MATCAKISPEMVNLRDIAGNPKAEEGIKTNSSKIANIPEIQYSTLKLYRS